MERLYLFSIGPLAWLSFFVFVSGGIWRLLSLYSLAKRKDGPFLSYMSLSYGLRSILHWMTPYGSLGWRENPGLTAATFVFHLCAIIAPLFALAHLTMLDTYFGIAIPALPDAATDLMSMAVVACCLFFAWRRLAQADVRYLSSSKDYVMLVLAVLPFATGILAHHQLGPPLVMSTLHVLSGEALLVAVPFTRLSHMLYGFFLRAYMGSEFGAIRHVKDW